MSKSFKAACVQMNSAAEIAPNLEAASAFIRAAAGAGAQLVMTPENTTLIEPNRAARARQDAGGRGASRRAAFLRAGEGAGHLAADRLHAGARR